MIRPELAPLAEGLLVALAQIRRDADWAEAARPVIENHVEAAYQSGRSSAAKLGAPEDFQLFGNRGVRQ